VLYLNADAIVAEAVVYLRIDWLQCCSRTVCAQIKCRIQCQTL